MSFRSFREGLALVGLAASAAFTAFTMSSCAHSPVSQEFPVTADAGDEVQRLESDLHAARARQDDVLAPTAFAQASNRLESARTDLAQGKDGRDVLSTVAEGRAFLDRSEQAAKVAGNKMQDVVSARQQALDAGAATSSPKELHAADESLRSTAASLEKDSSASVESKRKGLQSAYLDLELKAIDHGALSRSRELMEQANKEGAKDFAPRSLAATDKKIKDTAAYIIGNRHETEQIAARSADALKSAEHLLAITRESKSAKSGTSEDAVLALESEKDKGESEAAIANQERAELSDELARDKARSDAQLSALANERAFNQRFEEARAAFTPAEAQVYRQGNSLTIRLKGLAFPIGKSELRSSNYPLMAKVGEVIKSFGGSTVAVEGYTDSVGGKSLNERLSAARAQSVREYLVSTAVVSQADITSVGNGFEKPLASNRTPAGKAQNRRVDVIITPVMRQ